MTNYVYDPNKAQSSVNYPLMGNPHQHYYTARNSPILMAVQHITAGATDILGPDTSAEGTLLYSSATATVASYHGICDSDSIRDCLPDHFTAFAQGVKGHSFNSTALSLEIGLGTTDWRKLPKAWVESTIWNAAQWWAPRAKRYGIPLRVMTDRNEIDRLLAAGKVVGFTEHGTLDPGNRSDAGFISRGVSTFPWDMLFTYIRQINGGDTSAPNSEGINMEDSQVIERFERLERMLGSNDASADGGFAILRNEAKKYQSDLLGVVGSMRAGMDGGIRLIRQEDAARGEVIAIQTKALAEALKSVAAGQNVDVSAAVEAIEKAVDAGSARLATAGAEAAKAVATEIDNLEIRIQATPKEKA